MRSLQLQQHKAAPNAETRFASGGLRRRDTEQGATTAQIIEASGWQSHRVRRAFAGALKKKLRLEVISEKVGDEWVHRLPPA